MGEGLYLGHMAGWWGSCIWNTLFSLCTWHTQLVLVWKPALAPGFLCHRPEPILRCKDELRHLSVRSPGQCRSGVFSTNRFFPPLQNADSLKRKLFRVGRFVQTKPETPQSGFGGISWGGNVSEGRKFRNCPHLQHEKVGGAGLSLHFWFEILVRVGFKGTGLKTTTF